MQYLSFLLRGSSAVCFSPSSPLVLNEKQECFCTDIELTYIVKLPFCVITLLRRREGLQYRIRFNLHMMRAKFTGALDKKFFFQLETSTTKAFFLTAINTYLFAKGIIYFKSGVSELLHCLLLNKNILFYKSNSIRNFINTNKQHSLLL